MRGAGSVPSETTDGNNRRIRRGGPRGALPTGRALVGGLLVTLAAVVVFAAYAGAQGAPTTTIVVASRSLAPGTRVTAADVEERAVDVAPELAARSYDTVDDLVGAVTLGPLAAGDLVQSSALRGPTASAGAADEGPEFSFPIDRDRALNGDIRPGEQVELLGTFGSGAGASTKVLAAHARVLAVDEVGSGTLGSSGRLVLTVSLDTDRTVVDVAHASQVAVLTVVRAGSGS